MEKGNQFKPVYLEALSVQCGYPVYTTEPFSGEFKPKKSIVERYGKSMMNSETLYSEIEHLIIRWTIDGTKTAGSLTRDIMKLIESYES
jgi:hypothetical protein